MGRNVQTQRTLLDTSHSPLSTATTKGITTKHLKSAAESCSQITSNNCKSQLRELYHTPYTLFASSQPCLASVTFWIEHAAL